MLLSRAQKFCDYQDRYQQEVRDKLYSWGAKPDEVEQVIVQLIEFDYLNEERFAQSFVRGKFRIKHWGRNKIRQELKLRRISEYCIRHALLEISDEEYTDTLKQVIEKKTREIAGTSIPSHSQLFKVAKYVASRGFESDLIWDVLKKE